MRQMAVVEKQLAAAKGRMAAEGSRKIIKEGRIGVEESQWP